MYQRREGIGPVLVALIVIIIVAVAAIGAYVALAASNSNSVSTATSSPVATSSAATTGSAVTSITQTDFSIPTTTTTSSTVPTISTGSTTTTTSPTTTTQPSSSSGTSTGTTSTLSCSTTSASTSTSTAAVNIVPLLMDYSAMTIQGNGSYATGSSTQANYSYSESYSTVYASPTTYKVTFSDTEGGQNTMATAWILKSGSVIAIDFSGQNVTGSEAQSVSISFFSGFIIQMEADQEINFYTSANYFHSKGISTVTIGSTEVTVTSYVANSLPATYNSCGSQTTLTAYSFSVGVPQGASNNLVTSEHFAGSDSSNGQTTTFQVYLQVTSITLAS